MFEIEAGLLLSNNIEKCLIKTVKLNESPSSKELIKQLMIINEKWDYIVNTLKNLTIKLEKKR